MTFTLILVRPFILNLCTDGLTAQGLHFHIGNNWQQHHTIPEGKASVGSFDSLATANKEVLRGLLSQDFASFYQLVYDETQGNLPDPEKLVDKQNFEMVKNMYDSCMDETVIDDKGAEPLLPLLRDLRDLYSGDGNSTNSPNLSKSRLTRAIATLAKNGVKPLFDLFVDSVSMCAYTEVH
jgi:endothelin-converting enzyme